jgi:hypothetical protein
LFFAQKESFGKLKLGQRGDKNIICPRQISFASDYTALHKK